MEHVHVNGVDPGEGVDDVVERVEGWLWVQGASVPGPVGRLVQAFCLHLQFLHLCTQLIKVTSGLHMADPSSHPGFIPHHTWFQAASSTPFPLSLMRSMLCCVGHAVLRSQGPLPLSLFCWFPCSPAPSPFLCRAQGSHFVHLLFCIYTPMISSRD